MVRSQGVPPGVLLLQKCLTLVGRYRRMVYQGSVLFLTFVAYTTFHMSRRPLAVVKNSLNQDCSKMEPPAGMVVTNETRHNWCDWAPFDQGNANRLLGVLDSAYVFAYALCMFVSGVVAERVDLRYFLSLGMLVSGFFTYLFGLAYYMDVHSYAFFVLVQVLAGAAQCTGWPGVVSCVGNWFGKGRRGLIFGIWNAHLYVGNILGAYIAGLFVAHNWGLSFIVPGAILGAVGFVLFLFLVPHPEDVDCEPTVHHHHQQQQQQKLNQENAQRDIFDPNSLPHPNHLSNGGHHHQQHHLTNGSATRLIMPPGNGHCTERSPLSSKSNSSRYSPGSSTEARRAITFWEALRIPGVMEFSLCLFFSKLVSYTFLFWLPRYLAHSTGVGSQASAYLSIAFDVGGILGGVAAGVVLDHTGCSALTCVGFLGLAVPSLFLFEAYGSVSRGYSIALQIVCGALVNGPYALITTAVSAELGTHHTLKSNSKALSTVTAIIDGTGSIGAAVGPLVAGVVSEVSWVYVFYIMMASDFLALLSLLRTASKEAKEHCPSLWGWPCCRSRDPVTYREI